MSKNTTQVSTQSADRVNMNRSKQNPVRQMGKKWGFRSDVYDRLGNRRQVCRTFDTFALASEAYAVFMSDKFSGELIAPEKMTVGDWFDLWMETVRETLRPTTQSGYSQTIERRLRPYLGHVRIQALNEDHIRSAYRQLAALGTADNTMKGAHNRLKTCLDAALQEGKIRRNPARNVKPPKGADAKVMRTWSFLDLEKVSSRLEGMRAEAMWRLWLSTGLRRGELCGLYWSAVDLDTGVLTIDWQRTETTDGEIIEGPVKTKAGARQIPLSPRIVSLLRSWRASQAEERLKASDWEDGERGAYVFTSQRRTAYSPSSYGKLIEDIAARASVPSISPHEIRHTFATRAIESGMDVKMLSKLLGHRKVETTYNLYVHPTAEDARVGVVALSDRMSGLG